MNSFQASLILLLTALIWGLAFVAQSEASSLIGPLCYNGLRMLLGFLVLLPLFLSSIKKMKREQKKALLKDGVICGLLLFLASFFQQKGIEFTTAGKAGFITSLYILFVPVISFFLGRKSPIRIWLCVISGLVGAFLLSFDTSGRINRGDVLVFISSLLFALHVLFIDKKGKKYSGVELSAVQFLTAGSCALLLSLIFEENTTAAIGSSIVPVLYGGIGSCGIAYTLQIIGQKYTDATRATLILSLESVFSALGGALLLSETMSVRQITGCSILFLSVLAAELPEKAKRC